MGREKKVIGWRVWGRNLPTVPEVGEFEDFDNANYHDFEDFGAQKETKDSILDSPLETGNLQNFEKSGGPSLFARTVSKR